MEGLMISFTTLLGTIISLDSLLGHPHTLGYLLGVPIIPAIVLLCMMPFFPETPKYLYIVKEQEQEARLSIQYYYGDNADQDAVLAEFKGEHELAERNKGILEVAKDFNMAWPTFLGFLMMSGSMSTGILAMFNYSTKVFTEVVSYANGGNGTTLVGLGVDPEIPNYLTILMSTCNTLGGVGALFLIDRFGRRPLMLVGCILIIFCNCSFVVFYEVAKSNHIPALSYVACVILIVHVTIYNLGPGAVVWFFAAEITPQAARSVASSIAVTTNWVSSLILVQVFPLVDKAIQAYSFLVLFVAPSVVIVILLWFWLPETKNKTIEEISQTWWRGEVHHSAGALQAPKQSANGANGSKLPYMKFDSASGETEYGALKL